MGRAILKTIKAFTILGELFFTIVLSLTLFLFIMVAGRELFGLNKYVDAEIVSIANDIFTKENPDTTFGPYQYYIKYHVNGVEIALKEPVENERILKVGDTMKVLVNTKDGNIDYDSVKNVWEEYEDSLLGVLIFLIMLKILRFCINYLLENGKKEFLYVCKRLILHITSLIFFVMAYFNAVDILTEGPKYINGTYNWIRTEVVYAEDISPDDPYYQKMNLLYEYNGRWFRYDGNFVDELNRDVGDDCGLFIDTISGKGVDSKEDFISDIMVFVTCVSIGYITLWLGKVRILKIFKTNKKKAKTELVNNLEVADANLENE